MNSASDHGYSASGAFSMRCCACGSFERHCCDGQRRCLSFDDWAEAVDEEICKINETITNEVTAPYAEMYAEGISVMAAVERALA